MVEHFKAVTVTVSPAQSVAEARPLQQRYFCAMPFYGSVVVFLVC